MGSPGLRHPGRPAREDRPGHVSTGRRSRSPGSARIRVARRVRDSPDQHVDAPRRPLGGRWELLPFAGTTVAEKAARRPSDRGAVPAGTVEPRRTLPARPRAAPAPSKGRPPMTADSAPTRRLVAELEERAREALPWFVADYYGAVAGGRSERDADLAAWDAIRFRPAALRGELDGDTTTTVLGTEVRGPVLIAPMAQQNAADPRGEIAMAEAAARAGTLLGVSTNTALPFERIAAAGAPWWFQVYLLADRDVTHALIERAAEHGARALMLTVEMPVLRGERPGIEPLTWPEIPGKARLGNLTEQERALVLGRPVPNPGLDDIGRLRSVSGLPVLVKGVLRGEDARRAVDAGASGVVVSTHGGRRMDGSITAVGALAEVVDAVGADAEVYIDSGVRTGRHVLAALALGARAVFVGRPLMWALAVGGADEVAGLLGLLDREFRVMLRQSGAASIRDLGGLVARS
ncbi:alpha-hydroxy-acid oxidizing enzyme [Rathayibacter festucae DSM 15932]|uniref:Alpha-hydroxy-acid oxidizing enzyme n=2 Tax=Rathayibacter festucae TaxID=110937 RepID=A0A3Q9UTZ9_9MICO|nr:alpha-hydroxy-acid oxidizing enzyme [Rathayibacter festucae DSM 15932]